MQVISLLPVVAVMEFTFAFSKKHDQSHHFNVAMDQVLLFNVKNRQYKTIYQAIPIQKVWMQRQNIITQMICMFISLKKKCGSPYVHKLQVYMIEVKSETFEVILQWYTRSVSIFHLQTYPFPLKSKRNAPIPCFVNAVARSIMMLTSWKQASHLIRSRSNICKLLKKGLSFYKLHWNIQHSGQPCAEENEVKLLLQIMVSSCTLQATKPWHRTTTLLEPAWCSIPTRFSPCLFATTTLSTGAAVQKQHGVNNSKIISRANHYCESQATTMRK